MSRYQPLGVVSGAYLIGPVKPNPAFVGYSVQPQSVTLNVPGLSTSANTHADSETTDEAVNAAIERLTQAPGNSPEAMLQAGRDMELVIRHFDDLSAVFGAEAALTSLALDLASNSRRNRPAARKTRANRPVRAYTKAK